MPKEIDPELLEELRQQRRVDLGGTLAGIPRAIKTVVSHKAFLIPAVTLVAIGLALLVVSMAGGPSESTMGVDADEERKETIIQVLTAIILSGVPSACFVLLVRGRRRLVGQHPFAEEMILCWVSFSS